MVTHADDSLTPLLRFIVALGLAAVVILGLGIVTILAFAPPGQETDVRARIVGIYRYDPTTHQLIGGPSSHFAPEEPFAARVDWSVLPPKVVVGAHWYNTLDEQVGGVGPATAAELASRNAVVPVKTPPGLHNNLPGSYSLVVARYSGGRPVELLARTAVLVERSG